MGQLAADSRGDVMISPPSRRLHMVSTGCSPIPEGELLQQEDLLQATPGQRRPCAVPVVGFPAVAVPPLG